MPDPTSPAGYPGSFRFERDSFAFANELVWEYRFATAGGSSQITRRQPPPTYAHRCFVLTRAARQFFFHAEFQAEQAPLMEAEYRRRIRQVIWRNPRVPCTPERRVAFPGYNGLRAFSRAWEALLKDECGGAWRSYMQRSHWRMVLPISRQHQARTAREIQARLTESVPPVVHLVRFPQLTINHSVVIYDGVEAGNKILFRAYDPNYPSHPGTLTYEHGTRSFGMPANLYWEDGPLDVIEICRGWLL